MGIQLTEAAASEAQRMMEKEAKTDCGLRMGVKGGGCSGLTYALNFDSKKEGDSEFSFHGVRVYVDPKSLLYLEGTTLDYVDTLQEKGFRFVNPNANKSCGCGESFSV